MSELLKHYVPTFGALLTTGQSEPLFARTQDDRKQRTKVHREEIVELFKEELR
ncbi:hypothetical protein [Roseovarius rhodophyticola]|uniref:Uncharacterized protein n=1 Tax=Roseovarius rhodophyticola TaxID=3080827 RepID=A0ABZ2TK04_9RHOB|nr:hypothetical protein [Roseovarius sp. W115]MDV2930282.1 hypothetical protein [Roseovarius sp. W115]